MKNNILNKPAHVFNLDETGMPLDLLTPQKVVTLKGVKHATSVSTVISLKSLFCCVVVHLVLLFLLLKVLSSE